MYDRDEIIPDPEALEYLRSVMRDENADQKLRVDAAARVLRFAKAKRPLTPQEQEDHDRWAELLAHHNI